MDAIDAVTLMSVLAALLGVVGHNLKEVIGKGSEVSSPIEYFTKAWPQTALTFVLTAAGLILMAEGDYLNSASAFLMGYSGGSFGDIIGKRV